MIFDVGEVAEVVQTIDKWRSDFVRTVANVLELAGQDPGLDIEVTESLIMSDPTGNIEKLRAIRDLGVGIAIDKFLCLLRCDQMQGYLISKPLSLADMTAYLGRSRA